MRRVGPAAVEGKVGNNGASFTTELFGNDRQTRVILGGNATKKNKENAMKALHDDLENLGWVPKGQTLSLDI